MAEANSGQDLAKTMKALVLKTTSEPPTIQTVETPQPTLGSAVVRVLQIKVISYTREVMNGKRNYQFPMPLIPGFSAIGRVAAVGADATMVKPGDLVYVDCTTRSRDNPSDVFLAGVADGYTAGSKRLMKDVWRNWTYAEYCRAPLENLAVLDERRLLGRPGEGGLGYSIDDLSFISTLLVPYGGLRDIELQAGQTIIVAPATGPFGGAAVLVALAMGARVIAMGRNASSLAKLKATVPTPGLVETVQITGDIKAETEALAKFGQADSFFDIGPPEAYQSSHLKSAILSLRHGARISLMGGYREDVAIPHVVIMHKNMQLRGKWMYERSDIADLIKLVEHGILKVGEAAGSHTYGHFSLEQYKEAWDLAAEHTGLGDQILVQP
ncbi:hypothetical protein M409DRAFT_63218 [Zasmidium cellare ATCC 36951]|uniref:Uncharacterized protein n=1 Tax=Zasmidium cellare ATCC 36951 TaxID=1080233 RepID=A0A6A6D0N2_ZASCE|nr:uncharacterized protein M409DRAFT_63218 [Zasmidium cellare ATCC 36951]KAF2172573.1 hypothetical protein M409DRAFT_63218 [Zasmidium cellare ATCC 36951]